MFVLKKTDYCLCCLGPATPAYPDVFCNEFTFGHVCEVTFDNVVGFENNVGNAQTCQELCQVGLTRMTAIFSVRVVLTYMYRRQPVCGTVKHCKVSILQHRKEGGHYCMCYMYVTVFVRNAANLSQILPKASRTTFTSEVFRGVQALNRTLQMNITHFFLFFN
jgi:hypothetical protein